MNKSFTTDDIIGAFRVAIAAKGATHTQPRWTDYEASFNNPHIVQPDDQDSGSCRYASPIDGTPSCIVGWALFNLDREVFHLSAEHNGSASSLADHLRANGVEITPNAYKLLVSVQSSADSGESWGQAFNNGLLQLARI